MHGLLLRLRYSLEAFFLLCSGTITASTTPPKPAARKQIADVPKPTAKVRYIQVFDQLF